MSLFKKFKKVFKAKEKGSYDNGLEKTRQGFISERNILGLKCKKVTDEYFEELEMILIKADIGIKTVDKFLERLKKRVKEENIESTSFLSEVIVDELFMIYVE